MPTLEKISTQAKAYKEAKSKKGLWPWIVGIGLAIALAVGIYLLKRKLAGDQQALAVLRTKAEQEHVAALNKEVAARMADNSTTRLALQVESNLLHARANKNIAAIDQSIKQNAVVLEAIKNVDSWAELDQLNQKGRT